MTRRKSIAVIGSGISGLSAAWLLAEAHDVTLFEADGRLGGHSNTVMVGDVPVDTGFIVFNPPSYTNLTAFFDHLGVPTKPAPMGFAVSLDDGRSEYSGAGLGALVGHGRNLVDFGHWRMMADLVRFFRDGARWAKTLVEDSRPLGAFLTEHGYSQAFLDRHILPMAAAIWSTPASTVLDFPAASFFRFFANHGLLEVYDRPVWRTVDGGSQVYVRALAQRLAGKIRVGAPVRSVRRSATGVEISAGTRTERFDACVIGAHADDALSLLADADDVERETLGAFRYQSNHAVLHRDASLMPRRRRLWSSWNYAARSGDDGSRDLSVTYWMSELQTLPLDDVFVTLNPMHAPAADRVVAEFDYAHPVFDQRAMAMQRELWGLNGRRRTWFCGSYFGYGFHEDGLQAGLAVAEELGGVRRPWRVANESGRITRTTGAAPVDIGREAAE
ncbi:MAG TPA: FAD-dependent oxidoreductase [Hyphomicrobiaceae bacterium]|nr:FAD-dependent oxidoreductase [Hyphomicrobiaceae bacterium]